MAVKSISNSDVLLGVLPLPDGIYKGRFYNNAGQLPFAKMVVSNLGQKYYILWEADGSLGDNTYNSKAEFYNAVAQMLDDGRIFEYELVPPSSGTGGGGGGAGDEKKKTTTTTTESATSMSPLLIVGAAVLLLMILKKK